MGRFSKLAMGAAAALFLAAVTPATAAPEVFFSMGGPTAPPEAKVIVRPAMPHTGMIWREGHYMWRDGRYIWVNVEWLEPTFAHATWWPGHRDCHDSRT